MVVRLKVSVDDKNIRRRLRRVEKGISKAGKASTEQIARLIRDRIKLFMPKSTGESADAIGVITQVNARGYTEVQVGLRFKPHAEKRWAGTWFNLPFWMFNSDRALHHFRSGNIKSMRNVVPSLRKKYRRKLELDVNKLIR